MKAQTTGIFEYMRDIGPITGLIALTELGCMRLPARIAELKEAGIDVKDRWVEHTNKSGQVKRYKEYYL